ncbi:MAG: RDD family protein [Parafilimonas sp.]
MASIHITTTQNIDLEYELASLGDRILGRLLDGLIIAGYVILFIAIIGFGNFDSFINNNPWIFLLLVLPVVFYDLVSEILLNGQSVGKKVRGIKVISLNGEQASIGQYLIRWLFRIVDFSLSGSLVATICVAVTQKHQRLGDIIAATTLVKIRPRTTIQQTIYEPAEEINYTVTYPEVINLTDKDMQLIKEVIQNVQQTGNTMLAVEAMRKVEAVLNIKNKNQEPLNFLYTVILDYNHLASRL